MPCSIATLLISMALQRWIIAHLESDHLKVRFEGDAVTLLGLGWLYLGLPIAIVVLTAIFARQKITGFAFDVEVLFIARRLSLSVAEIPVNWVAQPGSKVNVVRDSVKMLWDIAHIRWLHRRFE